MDNFPKNPERFNPFVKLTSQSQFLIGDVITGRLISFDPDSKCCLIDLASGSGKIHLDEFSFFPSLSEVHHYLGKKITAEITGFSGDFVILSRKNSLFRTYEQINIGDILDGVAINLQKTTVFLDVGNGLKAKLKIENCSRIIYSDISKWIYPGLNLRIKVSEKISPLATEFPIRVSRKDAYPTLVERKNDYHVGDIISVLAGKKLNAYAYQVQVTPGIRGLIITPQKNMHFQEGLLLFGEIYKITPEQGIFLKLVKKF